MANFDVQQSKALWLVRFSVFTDWNLFYYAFKQYEYQRIRLLGNSALIASVSLIQKEEACFRNSHPWS